MDFLTTDRRGAQALYQVSLDMRDLNTRQREVQAMTAVLKETAMRQGTILSLDTQERIKTDVGVIEILPAWLWAVRQ